MVSQWLARTLVSTTKPPNRPSNGHRSARVQPYPVIAVRATAGPH